MSRRLAVPVLWLGAALSACGGATEARFAAPSAAIYDADADVYLVANVGGGPRAKDGDGSVCTVDPETGAVLAWLQGGVAGVTLDAPRGMALVDGVLWVADVDVVRRFDRRSGAPLPAVSIDGASMLYGVSAGPDGSVYVSDAGLGDALEPTGTDAIWRIGPDDEVSALFQGEALGQPTAISAQRAGVYAVSWASGGFFEVDYRGARTELGQAPQPRLAGLARVTQASEDGRALPTWLAASWGGAAVYRFALTGGVESLPVRLEQPGLLGVDTRRRRLLVPLSSGDRLHVEPL